MENYDVTLSFLKIDERAVVPAYAHTGDMCMDLSVIIDNDKMKPFYMDDSVHTSGDAEDKVIVRNLGKDYVSLEPGQSLVFHTGLKCETPVGWGMNIFVRSSVGIKKKLRLCNGTGKIDTSQYRGELLIGLHNYGSKARKIFNGDRIAQAEIIPIPNVKIIEVDNLSDTARGEGGLGSTGK